MNSITLFRGKIMDENSDLANKPMTDEESMPSVPIWERKTYTAIDPDLEQKIDETGSYDNRMSDTGELPVTGDVYILVDSTNGKQIAYGKKDFKSRLRNNILWGKHQRNSPVIISPIKLPLPAIIRNSPIVRQLNKPRLTTLLGFGRKTLAIGTLYEPVRTYAKAGLRLGALLGIVLGSINCSYLIREITRTLAFFLTLKNESIIHSFSVYILYPFLAFCLLLCLLLAFKPKYGYIALVSSILITFPFSETRPFAVAVLCVLVFTGFMTCLPAMSIGALIGWIRRKSLPVAPDAAPEKIGVVLSYVILPFLSNIALWFIVSVTLLLCFLYSPFLDKVKMFFDSIGEMMDVM